MHGEVFENDYVCPWRTCGCVTASTHYLRERSALRIARLAESDTTIEPGAQIGSHRELSVNLKSHRSHLFTRTVGLARCIVLLVLRSGVPQARGPTELFCAGV